MGVGRGIFFGVSVGPGDPELLTRKACRVLEACPVIGAAQTARGEQLALSIARRAVDLTGKEILSLPFSMARDLAVRQAAWRRAAAMVRQVLDRGQDVAMVVLGAVVSALIAGGIMAYWETIDWMELLSLVGSTTVTGIVIISLMIPCIYKLGVERSRLAIMVVFLVPMGVFLWYLGSGLALPTLASWIGKLLPVLLALLLLLLLWGSYLVSRRIYGKKEF